MDVIKTISGNSALIQISKNKSLLFSINDEKLEIENYKIYNDKVDNYLSINTDRDYDLIFIDGGHDYDVVKNDFQIAMKNKNKQAIIIMHDIECEQYEGPGKLWRQIEKNKKIFFIFM